MGKNNLKNFLNYVKTEATEEYPRLFNLVEYLKEERIKFVGNSLRDFLAMPNKQFDKQKIMDTVYCINDLARQVGYDFGIPTSWDDTEKYLRFTILEDLGEEFERQGN